MLWFYSFDCNIESFNSPYKIKHSKCLGFYWHILVLLIDTITADCSLLISCEIIVFPTGKLHFFEGLYRGKVLSTSSIRPSVFEFYFWLKSIFKLHFNRCLELFMQWPCGCNVHFRIILNNMGNSATTVSLQDASENGHNKKHCKGKVSFILYDLYIISFKFIFERELRHNFII